MYTNIQITNIATSKMNPLFSLIFGISLQSLLGGLF